MNIHYLTNQIRCSFEMYQQIIAHTACYHGFVMLIHIFHKHFLYGASKTCRSFRGLLLYEL